MLDSLEEAELPNLAAAMDPRLFQPLTSLTLTPDRKIRRMATHLLRTYEQHSDYPRAMAQLRFVAADENRPAFERRRAIAALSQLRNEASVSLFVELLPEADRGVAAAARVGLRVLTAHDFGFTREPWLRWLAGRSFESRVDWLIDGLGDSRAHLRALASRELAQLTGLKVALPVDASRAAFVAAQREYELWWAGLGRS